MRLKDDEDDAELTQAFIYRGRWTITNSIRTQRMAHKRTAYLK